MVRSVFAVVAGVLAKPPVPFKNETPVRLETSRILTRICFLTTSAATYNVVVSRSTSVDTTLSKSRILRLSIWLLRVLERLLKLDVFCYDFPLRGFISRMLTGSLSDPMGIVLNPAAVAFFGWRVPWSIDRTVLVFGFDVV